MDQPLLFLTSTSAIVPTGRNARKKARTDVVRQFAAPGPVHGTYATISLMSPLPTAVSSETISQRHQELETHLAPRSSHSRSNHHRKLYVSPRQVLAEQHRLLRETSLHLVDVQHLLDETTSRIRAIISKACQVNPSLYREGLHCRPWTRAVFPQGMLPSTPELSSAVSYLKHRLSRASESKSLDVVGLRKYSSALMHLRKVLRDPEARVRSSTLAASHILALCAMFDFGQNSEWIKLVEGVVVVIRFQSERSDQSTRRHFWSHAGPVMIQAFLTRQRQAVLDQPWHRVLEKAGQEMLIPTEDARNFADSARLMLAGPPTTYQSANPRPIPNHDDIYLPLQKAYDIRSRIKGTLLRDLGRSTPVRNGCSYRELQDERSAAIFGLDDFIHRLESSGQDVRFLATDSQMLYQQVMAADLVIGPIQEDESGDGVLGRANIVAH